MRPPPWMRFYVYGYEPTWYEKYGLPLRDLLHRLIYAGYLRLKG